MQELTFDEIESVNGGYATLIMRTYLAYEAAKAFVETQKDISDAAFSFGEWLGSN